MVFKVYRKMTGKWRSDTKPGKKPQKLDVINIIYIFWMHLADIISHLEATPLVN